MRDDIIRMAREAGFSAGGGFVMPTHAGHITHELERFAALVADAEAKRIHDEGMVTVGHMREQIAAEQKKWQDQAVVDIHEAVLDEREACADKTGEFARKWWSIHCASNKHMETTRKAHDDFCALQAAIRARS